MEIWTAEQLVVQLQKQLGLEPNWRGDEENWKKHPWLDEVEQLILSKNSDDTLNY